MKKKKFSWKKAIIFILGLICYLVVSYLEGEPNTPDTAPTDAVEFVKQIPDYEGEAYYILNNNVPEFTEADLATESYEFYSKLDKLGRCGPAMACIGLDLMPTEERGDIYEVKPTGWDSVMYDIVENDSLYNRCHLIGFQLSGENANEKNLITGTRYMNTEGMLDFENEIAEYVKRTGNHVIYRVTPYFEGENLVASGVQMEAYSVEDDGAGVCFNVYAYNVQPGIIIDYATGESALEPVDPNKAITYVLNTNSKKFHLESCESAIEMKEWNKDIYNGTRENLIAQGYEPCGSCNP